MLSQCTCKPLLETWGSEAKATASAHVKQYLFACGFAITRCSNVCYCFAVFCHSCFKSRPFSTGQRPELLSGLTETRPPFFLTCLWLGERNHRNIGSKKCFPTPKIVPNKCSLFARFFKVFVPLTRPPPSSFLGRCGGRINFLSA